MLDQNTDRMWNVIGAILIGAAIVFGFNTVIPSAFAQVAGLFDEVSDRITLGSNLIPEDLRLHTNSTATLDASNYHEGDSLILTVQENGSFGGMYFDVNEVDLKSDTYYVMTYSFKRTDGILRNIGGHTGIYSSGDAYERFILDGVDMNMPYDLKYMDGDTLVDRTGETFLEDSDAVHTVEFYFKTPGPDDNMDGQEDDQGVEKIYIQPNRGSTEYIQIEIRDLLLREVQSSNVIDFGKE